MNNPIEAETSGLAHGSPAADESSANRRDRRPLTRQDQLFLFCSLTLVTSCFLPWRVTDAEQGPWDLFSSRSSNADSAVWIFLLTLFFLTSLTVARPSIRPWFGIATAVFSQPCTGGVGNSAWQHRLRG
jgi:hypothetical protein